MENLKTNVRDLDDLFLGLFADKLDLVRDGDDLDGLIADLAAFGLPGLAQLTSGSFSEKRDYVEDMAWAWLSETVNHARLFDALVARLEGAAAWDETVRRSVERHAASGRDDSASAERPGRAS